MQSTVAKEIRFDGVGLHSGKPVCLVLSPAPSGHGIVFVRSDLSGDVNARIPARWDAVVPSQLCTLIRNEDGVELSTIEHIMAALAGCGVTNVTVSVDGPEVPILDGSAAPFVDGILAAGLVCQDGPARALKILKPVEVETENATAIL